LFGLAQGLGIGHFSRHGMDAFVVKKRDVGLPA